MKWLLVVVLGIGLFMMTGKFYNKVKSTNFVNDVSPRNIPTQPMVVKAPPPGPTPPASAVSVTEIASEDALLPAARFNEALFRERLESTPFGCERCISKTARYFRAQDPKQVSTYFI